MNAFSLDALTAEQCDTAAEANLVTHVAWVPQRLPGMRVEANEYLTVIDSGLASDTFNIVCRARLSDMMLPAYITRVVTHFQTVQRPFAWWVGPADRPLHLGQALTAAGLEAAESEAAMVADLDALDRTVRVPLELRIERVTTPEQVCAFAAVVAAKDSDVLRFYAAATWSLLDPACPLWLYVGFLGDVPVATSELTIGGGIVGLYNVCTLEAYRRRGIGSAMTLRPLLDARQQGYRTAVLQASEEGQRVYTRLGFRAVGRYTEYKPPTASPPAPSPKGKGE